MYVRRTLPMAKKDAKAFFDEHGRRPVVKDLPALDAYLRRNHDSSLKKLCNDVGIPAHKKKTKYNWTLEECEQIIQDFYDTREYRPTHDDLSELDGRLRYHFDTSVCAVANRLGIRGGKRTRTSIEDAHQEVQDYFDRKGFRPSATDLASLNHCLIVNHNSSVRKVCDELKLPGGKNLSRTIESVSKIALDFYKEHGRRPTKKDRINDDAWLKYQGSSLAFLCDKLGLPESARRA